MTTPADCPRLGRWFGCNFQPRYDEEPCDGPPITKIAGISGAQFRELFVFKVYVRDVCRTCGRTVERQA